MNIIGLSGLPDSIRFKKQALPNLSAREYQIAQGFCSAAALVNGDGIRAAAAEERFNGVKATNAFPINAIKYCLQAANIGIGDIDVRGYREYALQAIAGRQARPDLTLPLLIERDGIRHSKTVRLALRELPWSHLPMILGLALVATIMLLRAPGSADPRLTFAALMSYSIFHIASETSIARWTGCGFAIWLASRQAS